MRQFLFGLIFGSDELATRMFAMLQLRKLAFKRHARNKELSNKLAYGTAQLDRHVSQYHSNRTALEQAYKLELK